MRIHRLTVSGFGPYAKTVRVDVDALSRDGLFLLCGPNGAGKTSLLDAIVFALYGRVPGPRGQEKRLRSDHSDADTRTEVVCELTLRGQRLRIRRRPEQVRPKSRGTGTTKDQALLHVQRWVTGGWEPVSTRLDEGGEYLREKVGLTPEQFWQVVLLPQGEFAQFLRAEPDDRARVLETLFDAGRFAEVETWLAEHARTTRVALGEAEASVDRLVHQVASAARRLSALDPVHTGDPQRYDDAAAESTEQVPESGSRPPLHPSAPPESDKPDLVRAYLDRQISRAATLLKRASDEDDATETRLATAERLRDQSRQTVRATDRLLPLCRQRDVMTDRAGRIAESRSRLTAALRAEPLRPVLEANDAAHLAVSRSAADLLRHWDKLVALDVDDERPVELTTSGRRSGRPKPVQIGPDTESPDLQTLDLVPRSVGGDPSGVVGTWSRLVRDEVVRLTELEGELSALHSDENVLQELREAIFEQETSLDEMQALHAQLPSALLCLEARRDENRLLAAGLEAASLSLVTLTQQLIAARRAKELASLIRSAEADQLTREREAVEAREAWLDLRETRLAGIASELAADLTDGQSCPVCGSFDHPAPADSSTNAITAADEQAAADHHDRLEVLRQEAATQLGDLVQELGVCRGVSEKATVAALTRRLESAQAAHAAAEAAARALPGIEDEHRGLVADRDKLALALASLSARLAALRAQADALATDVAKRQRRMSKARGSDESLAGRRDRRSALADIADSLARSWDTHSGLATQRSESRARLAAQLKNRGFPGIESAQGALLDDDSRTQLSHTVREHEDAQTALAAALSEAIREVESELAGLTQMGGLADWTAGMARTGHPFGDGVPTDRIASLAARLHDWRDDQSADHERAGQAHRAAESALTQNRVICRELDELHVLIEAALAEGEPARATHREATDLAELTAGRGANVTRMRLRSYVLAAQLEQVAAAATLRLRAMTSGRYGIVASEDLRGGNRRSGLGVDVLDSYTGTQRPTKTLSGGESFMASLALALGLADVVTAESGGIVLDTLFVDEGFGGLDPDSLDAVMAVLDELRQGGRVVGIVSHVEELRSRIPMRLTIRTGPNGSMLADDAGGEAESPVSDTAEPFSVASAG